MRVFIRFFLTLSFIFYLSDLKAEEFQVFEENGLFGVLNASGEVSVPAVYAKLGWSNGTHMVKNGVIGYREKNLWGLITVKNKNLTAAKFYTLDWVGPGYIKASIKGNFSNRLFYGLLDTKGQVKVSFNHFSIESLGANWMVSDFQGGTQLFGVVSFENQQIIRKAYKRLLPIRKLVQATLPGGDIDLYSTQGVLMQAGLDSIRLHATGWMVYRDGYAGFISEEGRDWVPLKFKEVEVDEKGPHGIDFPQWQVFEDGKLTLTHACDSLSLTADDRLLAYLNGAHHLLVDDTLFQHNYNLRIIDMQESYFIVENSKTQKWSLLTSGGVPLMNGYDYIFRLGNYFAAQKSGAWYIVSGSGTLLNSRPFDQLRQGREDQIIVKKKGYWGILNASLQPVTPIKYDSISVLGTNYLVSYLNRQGLMDTHGDWILRSVFDEIINYDSFQIGRKRNSYVFFRNGKETYRATARPVGRLQHGLLLQSEDGFYGLLDNQGELTHPPYYERIAEIGDFLALWRDDFLELIDKQGQQVVSIEESYQTILGASEGFIVVKKSDRYGFIDYEGRLRISNRYANAGPFSEGLAPVYLQRGWGFIDQAERLAIQPYYEDVFPFQDGIAIVKGEAGYGLVDREGNEVMEVGWKGIKRLPTGNFVVENNNSRFGLINSTGKFLLRPDFEYLEDLGQSVIVARNGSWGILKYNGESLVDLNHKEVKVVSNLTLIRN